MRMITLSGVELVNDCSAAIAAENLKISSGSRPADGPFRLIGGTMQTAMKITAVVTLILVGVVAVTFAQTRPPQRVTLTGTLRGDRIAAGGESTGWSLRYKDKDGEHTVEVVLPAALATRPRDPATVTLTGTFGTREYVERGTVPVFRVTSIRKNPANTEAQK